MIYFDYNATTPVDPEVRLAVDDAMERYWANPSSIHEPGRRAYAELEKARARLADLLCIGPSEIVFTSGGTEADNMAILGSTEILRGHALAISAIEHPAVGAAASELERTGVMCRRIPVDSNGRIQIETLDKILGTDTGLVSVMAANNEIGTVQDLEAIGAIASRSNAIFHTDAVQAFGRIPIEMKKCNISLMSISSHKIYGPKGCGALIVRDGVRLSPRSFGGSQELSRRTGTQNLPAILGFVKAAELACSRLDSERRKLTELSGLLYSGISGSIEGVIRNGDPVHRIAGTLNICIAGVESQVMVAALDCEGICISGGSACHSGATDPSAVLLAIGRRPADAACGVRFSLGRLTTREEVLEAVPVIVRIVSRIRALG